MKTPPPEGKGGSRRWTSAILFFAALAVCFLFDSAEPLDRLGIGATIAALVWCVGAFVVELWQHTIGRVLRP